jgi:quercetin dioxygenase-like cupin family protein
MTARARTIAIIILLSAATAAGRQTPSFTRTQLQDQELSAANRHGVMSRSEFEPGATSGRHFHPGEELGYLLEGTLEITIDGQKPKVVKAGDAIFVPAGAIHNATNIGKVPAKVLATYVLEKGKPLATAVK